MQTQAVYKRLSEDVQTLQRDFAHFGALVDRLDVTIDKLSDISLNVSTMLSVHESKITSQEIITKQISDLVENRRVETEDKIQLLHGRISSGERELTNYIEEKHVELLNELKEMRKESTDQHNKLSGRITTMEKWIWGLSGGGVVIGFILSKVPWAAILH